MSFIFICFMFILYVFYFNIFYDNMLFIKVQVLSQMFYAPVCYSFPNLPEIYMTYYHHHFLDVEIEVC